VRKSLAQAVTFAVPHDRLGEDVAAAVTLRENRFTTEVAVQEYAAEKLAHFKVPRRVLILKEIPKGPTGKLQRIGLAEKLGLTGTDSTQSEAEVEFVAPRTPVEKELVEMWERIIGIQNVGVSDNFFDLGGDSILAARMFAQIHKSFGKNLPLTTLFQSPTIEQMAGVLGSAEKSSYSSLLVPIQSSGSKTPFFCMHGCLAEVANYFALARHLGQAQPFYALRAKGIYGEGAPHDRFEDMAASYIKEMREVQPEGPYLLGGAGIGGFIALEVAQQFLAQGQKVGLLVIMDALHYVRGRRGDVPNSGTSKPRKTLAHYANRLVYYLKRGQLHRIIAGIIKTRIRRFYWRYIRRHYRRYYRRFIYSSIARHINYIQSRVDYIHFVRRNISLASIRYVPKVYTGRITFFLSEIRSDKPQNKFYELAAGGLDVYKMPGFHTSMLREPYVRAVAKQLRACLDEASDSER